LTIYAPHHMLTAQFLCNYGGIQMKLRFIIVPAILCAVTLGAESSQAIDIPRPNIPRPTIDIPRPNIPRPTINIPRPNVTVPNAAPHLAVPRVSTPNPTAPKVSAPTISQTVSTKNVQKGNATDNSQKGTDTNNVEKGTNTDSAKNSDNATLKANKEDSSAVHEDSSNGTSTSNDSNGNANAAQSIAPPAPGNAASSNSSGNPTSSSVVNAGPLLMGGPGQAGCPTCKPGVVYNNVSPTCSNCTFTFNANAPGCATNGAACWIPATTPSASGMTGNNPGLAANNVNSTTNSPGGGANSDQYAIGRGTGDYNLGPITVADPTDPSKSINALPPANGNSPTTNAPTNNSPMNNAGFGSNVPNPGAPNAASPNSLPTVTIPLPNGSFLTATVNQDGTYNIPGQNTPLSNAGVLAAYNNGSLSGTNSGPGSNAQNPAPALSPPLNGTGGQAPNNTQTASGTAGTVNPTSSAPQIPTAAAGTNGGCLPNPCNSNSSSQPATLDQLNANRASLGMPPLTQQQFQAQDNSLPNLSGLPANNSTGPIISTGPTSDVGGQNQSLFNINSNAIQQTLGK
jgi:hypothetical protein